MGCKYYWVYRIHWNISESYQTIPGSAQRTAWQPGIGLRSKDFQRTDSAIPCLCHPPNATWPFFPGKVLLPTCYQTLSESLGLFQTPRGIRSWCMCRILPCSIVILEPTDALLNIMSSGGTLSWKSYWASDCAIHPWHQGDLATTACARWMSTPTSLLEKQFLRVPRSWWIFPIKLSHWINHGAWDGLIKFPTNCSVDRFRPHFKLRCRLALPVVHYLHGNWCIDSSACPRLREASKQAVFGFEDFWKNIRMS